MCVETCRPSAHSGHIKPNQTEPKKVTLPTPPAANADEADWLNYAFRVAEAHGLPGHLVVALIESKGPANFSGCEPALDGSGGKLYGPMLVHSGLLEDGQWAAPGQHGLVDDNGEPLNEDDLLNNPAMGIRAGVQHLRQLVDHYDGDLQKAVNHYETGDPENPDHALGNISDDCEATGYQDSEQTHHLEEHHGSGGSHGGDDQPEERSNFSETEQEPQNHVAACESNVGQHPPFFGYSAGGPMTGEIPAGKGSSHHYDHVGKHGHGFLLDADAHNSAFSKAFGKPPEEVITYVTKILEGIGAYNKGQNTEQKTIGAYLAANLVLKIAMMPPGQFGNETEAGLTYGQLKLMAMNNDADGIRNLLKREGGLDFGLTDTELTKIWGTNEHNNLHAILFGNRDLANAVHMTSLNDNDGHEKDGMNPGRSGGYNNKGEYPQWGWFEGLHKVTGWFPNLLGGKP